MIVSIILIPLVGAAACWIAGRRAPRAARWAALVATLAAAGVAAPAVAGGDQYVTFGVAGFALDGLSAPLVALTVLLGVVAVLASWRIEQRPSQHFALLLLLQAAVSAVFLADGILVFYAAWEAVLIPMFFLIGGWGHEDRRHAALKFFIYTFAGSALMFVGLLIVLSAGGSTLSGIGRVHLSGADAPLVFWLLVIGFAVKIPVFPLHTWLPDAHVEAPTAGSIMLAGVLLKMGGYGIMRVAIPIAPATARAAGPIFETLGVIAIVYGAVVALAQTDLKRLVAYSSVSHMGFVILAIGIGTPLALTGAMLVMVAHGLTAALLFLLVGMLYERTHTRALARLGGLMRPLPAWGTAFVFASLASLGLPGLAGFPGELATFLEATGVLGWWIAALALGVLLAGAYTLRAVRAVAQGPVPEEWSGLRDLDRVEAVAIAPLAVGIVLLGVMPSLVSGLVDPVVSALAHLMGAA